MNKYGHCLILFMCVLSSSRVFVTVMALWDSVTNVSLLYFILLFFEGMLLS